MKDIKEIILTGGPCSGKTTALSHLQSWLLDLGFRPLLVPEVATLIILGGVQDIGKIASESFDHYMAVQKEMLRLQLDLRKRFLTLAQTFSEPVVLIYDRGPMDGMAYMPEKYFWAMLKEEKLYLDEVRDSFEAVIHLVTAANGAEEYYTTANNQARRESPAEAWELDIKTQNAWTGHPHLKVIDNSTGFDLKIKRLTSAVARVLGIPVPLEIERKYLLKEFNLQKVRDRVQVVEANIRQSYIQHPTDGRARIRERRATDGSAIYYYTVKTSSNSSLVRYERERRISATEYVNLEQLIEPGTRTIEKIRYCFVWNSQYFELDVFQTPKDLVYLEVELTEENDQVDLPPFLKVEKEVSNDPSYSNHSLAKVA